MGCMSMASSRAVTRDSSTIRVIPTASCNDGLSRVSGCCRYQREIDDADGYLVTWLVMMMMMIIMVVWMSSVGQPRIGIFAIKHIREGEPLSYDYQFDTKEEEAFKCHCGTDKCRGIVRQL